MAPVTFTLVALGSHYAQDLLDAIKALPSTTRALWVGKCHHWIHLPHLSTTALNGPGPEIQKWDYLIVGKGETTLSSSFTSHVKKTWSITGDCSDEMLAALPEANTRRANTPAASLPNGWSTSDHSGLDAAIAPSDLEASLAMTSHPMGSSPSTDPLVLKDFIRTFGTTHTGPIAMFNLLSYLPDQRSRYFQYVQAFTESVGIKYGGEPVVTGFGVSEWSSREEDEGKGQEGKWEDTALIYYPSLWHFGKMLDDEGYMEVDRKFKQGVVRDNPLICCTEVKLD